MNRRFLWLVFGFLLVGTGIAGWVAWPGLIADRTFDRLVTAMQADNFNPRPREIATCYDRFHRAGRDQVRRVLIHWPDTDQSDQFDYVDTRQILEFSRRG